VRTRKITENNNQHSVTESDNKVNLIGIPRRNVNRDISYVKVISVQQYANMCTRIRRVQNNVFHISSRFPRVQKYALVNVEIKARFPEKEGNFLGKSYPCNRPWRSIGLRDVEGPTLSRQ
jgi:hypothetical protein